MEASRPARGQLRTDFSTIGCGVGRIRANSRLYMVEDFPMHERTTDAAEAAVPLPEQQGRSYTPGESEQGRAMTSAEPGRPAGHGGRSHDPLTRSERLLVTVFVTMFGTMLAAGALGFTTLSGQLLDMQEQIGNLQNQTSAQLLNMQEQIGDMQEEIGGLRVEMHEEIGGLRVEMHEEIGKLSERMTRIETLIETHLVPASNARDPAGP